MIIVLKFSIYPQRAPSMMQILVLSEMPVAFEYDISPNFLSLPVK